MKMFVEVVRRWEQGSVLCHVYNAVAEVQSPRFRLCEIVSLAAEGLLQNALPLSVWAFALHNISCNISTNICISCEYACVCVTGFPSLHQTIIFPNGGSSLQCVIFWSFYPQSVCLKSSPLQRGLKVGGKSLLLPCFYSVAFDYAHD